VGDETVDGTVVDSTAGGEDGATRSGSAATLSKSGSSVAPRMPRSRNEAAEGLVVVLSELCWRAGSVTGDGS
jgi:hypothetical protein